VLAPKVVAKPKSVSEKIDFRAAHLTRYQGPRLAARYRKLVDGVADPRLREAVAKGYHKLLAYKDEYEVARLHLDTMRKGRGRVRGRPQADLPPRPAAPVAGRAPTGGRRSAFGAWIERACPLLARLKSLRGTPFDPSATPANAGWSAA
jgi:indolepyruvate ferredoxin oxidoreductase